MKITELSDAQTQSPTDDATGASPARLPYVVPELKFFGSVASLTATGTGTGTDGGTAGMSMQSDINCKQNIVRVGESSSGIGLYLFDYKPEFTDLPVGRQFGVLAQEVEKVMPIAVSVAANGYKQVDYSLLGISHTRH